MLWFRTGTLVASIMTLVIALLVLASVFVMCTNPSNGRAMNVDPYYNGWLGYYIVVLFSQMSMVAASVFGLVLSFRIWRNNHQMDHKLRRLFSMWLATLCFSSLFTFIMGILGLVRYREPQEEIMSLFEIFSKYNQDVKFVGSFERYQRENSCCGINGPDDWMLAQFKQGGGTAGGVSGMSGGYDSYMGSPSTGKCHLTPPTIPMGCGKKLMEDIHWTMTCYSAIILFETLCGLAAAGLGWYCFFYWIEKEVIIIPEDEVSNLIVIEPESTVSSVYTEVTASGSLSNWSRSQFSMNGSQYSRPDSRYNSQSRYSRTSGSRGGYGNPSVNPYPVYPQEGGYSNNGYFPNTPRPSRFTGQFPNDYGTIASMGGPHSAYLSMQMIDPNANTETFNQNIIPPARIRRSGSSAAAGDAFGAPRLIRLHTRTSRQSRHARSFRDPGPNPRVPPPDRPGMNFASKAISQRLVDGSSVQASSNLATSRADSGGAPKPNTRRVPPVGNYMGEEFASVRERAKKGQNDGKDSRSKSNAPHSSKRKR